MQALVRIIHQSRCGCYSFCFFQIPAEGINIRFSIHNKTALGEAMALIGSEVSPAVSLQTKDPLSRIFTIEVDERHADMFKALSTEDQFQQETDQDSEPVKLPEPANSYVTAVCGAALMMVSGI